LKLTTPQSELPFDCDLEAESATSPMQRSSQPAVVGTR